jgi:hypothetical protein
MIIQELLEVIIQSNHIGLQVSEIEGDAILFYKFGDPPDLQSIYKQVEAMFCAFHKNLGAYNRSKYCHCKACLAAVDLTLKVISHYGEFTGYSVQNFHKLIGRDIIVAHQLLKNDIPQHEYWLVTNTLAKNNSLSGFAQWMEWKSSTKQTENGEIPFYFTRLAPLKDHIIPETPSAPDLGDKEKVVTVSKIFDTEIIALFHASGDFANRTFWQEGVIKTEEVTHLLPRVGMKYKSISETGEAVIRSSSYEFRPERIEFTESDETNKTLTRYLLEKINDQATKLTIEYYIQKKFASQILFNLFQKKKYESKLNRSLDRLAEFAKTIILPAPSC